MRLLNLNTHVSHLNIPFSCLISNLKMPTIRVHCPYPETPNFSIKPSKQNDISLVKDDAPLMHPQ